MAKSKNSVLAYTDLFKVFYSFRIFENKIISKSLLCVHLVALLLLSGIIAILRNHIDNYSSISDLMMFSTPFILFFLIFLIYVGLYVFLRALEDKGKDFLESFLVFASIILPFMVVGNLLNYLALLFFNDFVIMTATIVVYLYGIYFLVSLVMNFRNYYNVSYYKLIACLVLVYLVAFSIFYPALISNYLAGL